MTGVEEAAFDVVVAGGGVGGLMAAFRARQAGARVLLLGGSGGASQRISSMNTALDYCEEDTPARLFDDIVRAGKYINNASLAAAAASAIGPQTRDLAEMGVPFSADGGRLARRQTAGTTWTRAVYSLGMIGVDVSRRLLDALRGAGPGSCAVIPGGLLLELDTGDNSVRGGLAYDSRSDRWIAFAASAVVLATGGCGSLFESTTNPRGSKGTGYAIALEAGAALVDMEFISFEPYITLPAPGRTSYDLPTTVMREGGRLVNALGEEFVDAQSATKDDICRAMLHEVRAGRGTPAGAVLYDVREMRPSVRDRYVQITQALRGLGIEAGQERLEVMPAQHFVVGGIRVGRDAQSDVPGLFAVGEAAGGCHGAHRLAGNGGMEVVALGSIAGENAAAHAREFPVHGSRPSCRPRPELTGADLPPDDRRYLEQVRVSLTAGCGILRDADRLRLAHDGIKAVLDAGDAGPVVRRGAVVASAIVSAALAREECRGDHYRTDCPGRDDVRWLGNLVSLLADGELRTGYRPVGAPAGSTGCHTSPAEKAGVPA